MALKAEHEIHSRRRSRNVGLGLVLVGFVALVFGLTIAKVQQGHLMEAFDHQPRVSLTPTVEPAANAPATASAPAAVPATTDGGN